MVKQAFFIGQQRSGSNLLRLILNSSSLCSSPHPPHILPRFEPLIETYGDLDDDDVFRQLVTDVCELVNLNPVKWPNTPIEHSSIFNKCSQRSLLGIHAAIMNQVADHENKPSWVCKSMDNVDWVDRILNYHEEVKFIYLVRDARDVALSFQNTLIGFKHPYFLAKEWASIQRKCLRVRDELGNDQVHLVKYEDLIGNPVGTIARLCDFLDIPFESGMLDYHKTDAAKNASSVSQQWTNVTQPIIRTNSQKYETQMSDNDISIIQQVAGREMVELGYELKLIEKDISLSDEEIRNFEIEEGIREDEMVKSFDHEDLEKRKKQKMLIDEIIKRNALRSV